MHGKLKVLGLKNIGGQKFQNLTRRALYNVRTFR